MQKARIVHGIGILLIGVCTMASECDEGWDCYSACSRLVQCENEWLLEDDEDPMSDREVSQYEEECEQECDASASYHNIECIMEASCNELAQGECRL